jgi:thiamine kinase-like enzyme
VLQPEAILAWYGDGWLQSGLLGISDKDLKSSVEWPSLEFIKLTAGLTNRNYLFSLADKKFVLRIAADNSDELSLDRSSEYCIHQHAAEAGLVSPILFRHESDDFWLREFIVGEELNQQALTASVLQSVSAAFDTLHADQSLQSVPQLDLLSKASAYWRMIDSSDSRVDGEADFQPLRTRITELLQCAFEQPRLALCHLDPTLNNWIQSENGLQLLDWEYAALANPLLDYAAFVQGAELDQQQQEQLLHGLVYSDQDWQLAQKQMQALSLLWYKAQKLISAEEFKQQCQALIKY